MVESRTKAQGTPSHLARQGGSPAIGGRGLPAPPPRENFGPPQEVVPTRRLIGYIRVSTKEQAGEGHSLAAQRYRLEAFCVAQECRLVDVYEDAGESGSTLDRPGLQAALAALEAGQADGLVVV